MDSPAVDLQKFTDVPFAIERPAEESILADHATALLGKKGLRMCFGKELSAAKETTAKLSESLPDGFALLDRQTARKMCSDESATTIISGISRPNAVSKAPSASEAMQLSFYQMTGHALLGADREKAATFAALTGIQKGISTESLDHFVQAHKAMDRGWGLTGKVSETLVSLMSQRARMVADPSFAAQSQGMLAHTAKRFSEQAGFVTNSIMLASLDPNVGVGSAIRPLMQAMPPVPEPKTDLLFEAHAFGSAPLGPNMLPPEHFSDRTQKLIQGMHPDLLKVIRRAREICTIRFDVVPKSGGLRTEAEQAKLKSGGHSRAKTGRHTLGYAVDLVPISAKGNVDFSNLKGFDEIKVAMEAAANELKIPIQWGGNWKKLVDKPHFELDRKAYPAPGETPEPEALVTAFR